MAGNIEWQPLLDQVGRLFGDWQRQGRRRRSSAARNRGDRAHLTKELEQTQIAVAYPSVPIGDADYYAALGAVNVLSRRHEFAAVHRDPREGRPVLLRLGDLPDAQGPRPASSATPASRNERAQRTLDVLLRELRRLPEGIEAEEVERVQAGLKSSLIMQQESTAGRALSLASDWYYLGRVRSFEEIQAAIDGLTPENIVKHVRRYPPGDFTIVTLGPKPLTANTN